VGTGEVKLLVLLTKADKLSRNAMPMRWLRARRCWAAYWPPSHADIGVVLFSALSRQGLGDAALVLRQWHSGLADPDAGAPLSPP
jgi:GTP-binding protein